MTTIWGGVAIAGTREVVSDGEARERNLLGVGLVVGFATLHVWQIKRDLRNARECRKAKREHALWKELPPLEQQSSRDCRRDIRKWREADSVARQRSLWDRIPRECRETVSSTRREEAEQRVREAELERGKLPPTCQRPIEEWRREEDLAKKTMLYDRMNERCKETITRQK